MAQRSSLLDDSDLGSIGAKKSSAGGGTLGRYSPAQIAKVAVGAVALIVGCGLILNSLGVFGDGQPPVPKLDAEEVQAIEEQRKEKLEMIQMDKNVTIGSS
jgi:hypothetical protein